MDKDYAERTPPSSQPPPELLPTHSQEDIEDLSQYRIMTVSKAGFRSAGQDAKPAEDCYPAPAPSSLPEPEPEPKTEQVKISESEEERDVEYELVVDPGSGVSAWVPRAVRQLTSVSGTATATPNSHTSTPLLYANPFGGSPTGHRSRGMDVEDGRTHDHYVDMRNGGTSGEEGLIIVEGTASFPSDGQRGLFPYMPHHIGALYLLRVFNTFTLLSLDHSIFIATDSAIVASAAPPPMSQKHLQVMNVAANTTTTGVEFPKGYTYVSKVTALNSDTVADNSEEVEVEEEGKDVTEEEAAKEEEETKDFLAEESVQNLSVPSAVETSAPQEGTPHDAANQDLIGLLHQLVHTQQSTMQVRRDSFCVLVASLTCFYACTGSQRIDSSTAQPTAKRACGIEHRPLGK